jgi:GntP family gluconate:H+ symporter
MPPLLILLAGMAVVLGGVLLLRLHAFLALIAGALTVALLTSTGSLGSFAQHQVEIGKMSAPDAAKLAGKSAAERVATQFGDTCGKIGLLIAFAAIIGKCLLDSGSAQRIVEAILALFGVARAQLAFLVSSFLLAIPVYFDTVFYLLIPLAKAMRRKTGKNYLLYILTVVAGGTMAHSLVPPTPGPLFVAGELGVDLGTMIVGGLSVGLVTVVFGYFYASRANRRWDIPLPEEETATADSTTAGSLSLPPFWLAILPIFLPLVLIGIGTRYDTLLADKNVALGLGAAIALLTLAVQNRRLGRKEPLEKTTQSALMSGAAIILITAAGGAFGGVLHQTGIADSIQGLSTGAARTWAIPIVFAITALVRTAQGSATVAMITAAPIAAAFIGPDLPFHPVYLALAIGCGSKPIPWMNDSGFWIITRMTGMKESETLRIVTPMMSLMGLLGGTITWVGSLVLPLL